MTEIGHHDDAYLSTPLEQKLAWFQNAPGVSAIQPSQDFMAGTATLYTDSDGQVRTTMRNLGARWTGDAAVNAGATLQRAADWSQGAGTSHAQGGRTVEGYGHSFESLRGQVHWDDPLAWGWGDTAAAVASAVTLNPTILAGTVATDYFMTAQHNRTNDATAVAALRAHEEQTRSAVATFPSVPPPQELPPTAPEPGARRSDGVGPLPGHVPPAQVTTAGAGGAGGAPAAGAGGGVGVGADGQTAARGALPGPGGGSLLVPAAVPPATVTDLDGAGRPGAGAPGLPVGGAGAGGPGASGPGRPRAGEVGADGLGGLGPGGPGGLGAGDTAARAAVPGALGTGPLSRSGPGAVGPGAVRAPGGLVGSGFGDARNPLGPGGRGAPFVDPPGSGVRTGPGGVIPTEPLLRPGAGPGPEGGWRDLPSRAPSETGLISRGPTAGTQFAERLPTGVATAESAVGGPRAGAAAGVGTPFLGGMGVGGGGDRSTEHRNEYWVRSAEPFDVPLPPHVDGVIQGGGA